MQDPINNRPGRFMNKGLAALILWLVACLVVFVFAAQAHAAIPDGTIELPKHYSACPPEVRPDCAGLWRKGDVGSRIVRVQLRLNEYGLPVKITGMFDAETLKVVKAFQRNKGLSADGIIGPETRAALAEPVTLRTGAEGATVADVQIALNRMGYGPVTVDGIMGPETKAAIEKFQKRNRVKQDGIVGPETRQKMANGGRHASTFAWLWGNPRWRGFVLPKGIVESLVKQESGGRHNAVSSAGALGKWQFMPGTARKWGPKCGYPWLAKASYADLRRALFNPDIGEDLARCYLNYAYRRYNGDLALVLASYNSGFGNADIALRCKRRRGRYCLLRETYYYTRNILSMAGEPVPALSRRT